MVVLDEPRVAARLMNATRARPALAVGILGGLIGFLGSWIPSYWGDEAASVMSATRSWPSLAAELSTIDGVHGVYYAFLHLWTSVFGISELATRFPSAVGAGFMVAGTVILARLFTSTRFALVAGVVAIVLPRATLMATEARSYAIGTAAAVWLTVLLVRLVRRGAPPRWWILYGVGIAASVYLFMYLGLMLLAHAAYVVVVNRSALRAWVMGAGTAVVLAAPIVWVGYTQREQIDFLSRRHYATPINVLVGQWFGTIPVAILCWALIIVAAGSLAWRMRRGATRGGTTSLAALALAWLILPSTALLVGNAVLAPMYNVRYLSFSTPAVAILVAMGIAVVVRRCRARPAVVVGSAILIGLIALSAPGYVAQRTAWAKDGGSDWRQVAEYIGAHAEAGDAVVFDQSTKPSRDPRLALHLYPGSFTAVTDIALVTRFDLTDGLWDRVVPIAGSTAELAAANDVWAVELPNGTAAPTDVAHLESIGYRVESATLIHRTTIYHLTRE